ncbi:MAG: hypothetical protein R3F02_21860 [Thiolinea sp.]
MVNLIDVVIIAIALIAALGALLLLRPQVDHRDAHRIRKILQRVEKDQKQVEQILSNVKYSAEGTEKLSRQLQSSIAQINAENSESHARAETAEQTIRRAKEAEQELNRISNKLGERIQQIQTYWNSQLEDTTGSVRQIKSKLHQGLTQVDEGLIRLQEQERMAQGFTQKLLQHQKEHLASQQKNTLVSTEVHAQLENILKQSASSLEIVQEHQKQADKIYNEYAERLRKLEQQANEQFAETFQSTDMARQELTAGLQESRQNLEKLRQYEVQGSQMHERIKEQFNQIDPLKVERLGETVNLTDEMCVNLQEGLENARALLSTLEEKTAEVIDASEKKPPAVGQINDRPADNPPRNLFSLRANR